MTSDRPPAEIADVDERLITRLVRRTDRRHRRAGLRDAHGDPQARSARSAACGSAPAWSRSSAASSSRTCASCRARSTVSSPTRRSAASRSTRRQVVLGPRRPRRAARRAPTPPRRAGEFASFLTDIASAVAQHVEQWKTRLSRGDRVLDERRLSAPARSSACCRSADAADKYRERCCASSRRACRSCATLERQVARLDRGARRDTSVPRSGSHRRSGAAARARAADASPPPGPSAAFTRAGVRGRREQPARGARRGRGRRRAGRRATTRCSFTGRAASARRTCSTRSATGCVDANAAARRVACVPAQLFVDELIAALQEGTVERWRARYRAASTRCSSTTCSSSPARSARRKSCSTSSTRSTPPGSSSCSRAIGRRASSTGLEERLRSRFEGGLVVADAAAGPRAARAALRALSRATSASSRPARCLAYLAERPVASVREIIGIGEPHRRVGGSRRRCRSRSASFARSSSPDDAEPARAAAIRAGGGCVLPRREKIVWQWPDVAGASRSRRLR